MELEAEALRLLECHQLKAEDGDRQMSDQHLGDIAAIYFRLWRALPSRLGVERMENATARTNELSEKRAFFYKWRKVKGSEATYTRLITALLDVGSREDAERVCKMLRSVVPTNWPDSQQPSTMGLEGLAYTTSLLAGRYRSKGVWFAKNNTLLSYLGYGLFPRR